MLLLAGLMPANAQDATVALQSSDGTLRINGQLIDFSDGFYRVRTALGEMRISASRVDCEGPGCPVIQTDDVDLRIVGSETMGEGMMPLLITGYATSTGAEAQLTNGSAPGETIANLVGDGGFGDDLGSYLVQSSVSDAAFRALLDETAEIGMSARRITREEARALRDSGAGNMIDVENEHVVGVDSLIIVTHPDNPVDTVYIEDLAAIYRGQVSNWSELGGPDLPINIYARPDGSAIRAEFERGIYGPEGALQRTLNVTRSEHAIMDSNAEMATSVSEDPAGIGYVGYAFQRGAKPLNVVNECGITSSPNAFSAKTEEYPLNRRLYLYTRGDTLSDAGREFVDFAKSAAADGVVAKSGFINLDIKRLPQDTTGSRMRDLIQNTTDPFELVLMRDLLVDMLQWDRLSTTFRFASGSNRLDRKAEADMERLIDYLRVLPEGTEVAVVGFTDSDGAFEANRSLSIGRAQSVARAIDQAANGRLAGVQFEAKGFGELSPAACNTNTEGKAINRRVEIWIRGSA